MAEEKKDDKMDMTEFLKTIVDKLGSTGNIDIATLATIMSTKKSNEKSIDTVTPLLLMMLQQQKPNPLESLMQMFIVSKLIDQMTQKEEDDLTKAFKFKMMMQMMEGGKKESAIDDYIKLMQVLNPSKASEIEKLRDELLRMNEANQKSIEEIKKANETNLSQLRDEILMLYKDLTASGQSSSFEEVMKKQLEFQKRVREYAEAMGWIKEMKLPSSKEEWQLEDYLTVIDKIFEKVAETATNVVVAMTGMRVSGEKKEKAPTIEKITEEPQQVQEQPVPQPQPAQQPAPSIEEEKKD